MPIHDWTRVPPGLYHHFHQSWCVAIADRLNAGVLPKNHFALVEQRVGRPEADVLAISADRNGSHAPDSGGVAIAEPKAKIVERLVSDEVWYAKRANRIAVHHLGEIVAVIEIVSPGNKHSERALKAFVDKSASLLEGGTHLLIVDLFPPTPRDPAGLHSAIVAGLGETPTQLSADKPLACVSYHCDGDLIAYIEPLAVGDPMPDMPLFLSLRGHVVVPLAATYDATWAACPQPIRDLVAPPAA